MPKSQKKMKRYKLMQSFWHVEMYRSMHINCACSLSVVLRIFLIFMPLIHLNHQHSCESCTDCCSYRLVSFLYCLYCMHSTVVSVPLSAPFPLSSTHTNLYQSAHPPCAFYFLSPSVWSSLMWKLSLRNDEWEAIHGENINVWFVFSENVFKAKSFKLFMMITCIEVHIFLSQFCWYWFGVKVTLTRMSEIVKIKAESFVSHCLSDWVQTLYL